MTVSFNRPDIHGISDSPQCRRATQREIHRALPARQPRLSRDGQARICGSTPLIHRPDLPYAPRLPYPPPLLHPALLNLPLLPGQFVLRRQHSLRPRAKSPGPALTASVANRFTVAGARASMWKIEIARRCDRHKFVVLPKRWIVARTIRWISRKRISPATSSGTS